MNQPTIENSPIPDPFGVRAISKRTISKAIKSISTPLRAPKLTSFRLLDRARLIAVQALIGGNKMDIDISSLDIDDSNPIDHFRDGNAFLRNDATIRFIDFEGLDYPSVEHAFQAAKTTDENIREEIAETTTGREAKQIGRNVDLPDDWEERRLHVMENLLRKKFNDSAFKQQLLGTDNRLIRMVNQRDAFWGVIEQDRNEFTGQNNLGKLIMKIRGELQLVHGISDSSNGLDLDQSDDQVAIYTSAFNEEDFKLKLIALFGDANRFTSSLQSKFAKELVNLYSSAITCELDSSDNHPSHSELQELGVARASFKEFLEKHG